MKTAAVKSKYGKDCRIATDGTISITSNGRKVTAFMKDGVARFPTKANAIYSIDFK